MFLAYFSVDKSYGWIQNAVEDEPIRLQKNLLNHVAAMLF